MRNFRTVLRLAHAGGADAATFTPFNKHAMKLGAGHYEDEIAVIVHCKTLPYIVPTRVGLIGMSHGGEMVLKITSEYHGATVGVAAEPASHEFLALTPTRRLLSIRRPGCARSKTCGWLRLPR